MLRKSSAVCTLVLLAMFVTGGCKKKPPAPPPPPPPPPPAAPAPPPPNAPAKNQLNAEPSSIERGQSATLRWSVTDATSVSIDQGIGTVQATGNRRVFPSDSTTYTMTVTGPGGSTTATATVNVTAPPPPPPPPAPPKASLSERLAAEVRDAYFDYDKSDIREDARAVLTRNADALRTIFQDFPNATVVIEGHADERGSAEYNLGLSDRRASSARDFLVQLGVPTDRLRTVSYGKERPVCTESNESCWQQNRRAHFAAGN